MYLCLKSNKTIYMRLRDFGDNQIEMLLCGSRSGSKPGSSGSRLGSRDSIRFDSGSNLMKPDCSGPH